MTRNPFFRVAAVSPRVNPADVDFNVGQIIDSLALLEKQHVDLAVFPELCVTGYTCADLFLSSQLLEGASRGLELLCEFSSRCDILFIVGAPAVRGNALFNMAFAFHRGKIVMETGKRFLPNYGEFYEKRWFKAWDGPHRLLDIAAPGVPGGRVKVGIEICEDLWVPSSPSTELALSGADVVVNLSASDDVIGKYSYLLDLIKMQSGKSICAYVYAGAGFGESSTDLVFDGKTVIAENGRLLAKNTRWLNDGSLVVADIDIEALRHDRAARGYFNSFCDAELFSAEIDKKHRETRGDFRRCIEPLPFVPPTDRLRNERCSEIINIQTAGLARRLDFTRCDTLVVGISGGLDSTLALLVACNAFDRLKLPRTGIVAVTMPGFGTTKRTRTNAVELCESLGVTLKTIPIDKAVNQHFLDIDHNPEVHDVTYENAQARMRTLLLMNLANKLGGMVLGTGDLSELALGWATYNGDHMSMYNVNAGVPKTLVKHLVDWYAQSDKASPQTRAILEDIIATPISPELLPPTANGTIAQKTEDLVGPYELHDFFIYYTLRYGFGPRKIYVLATQAFKEKFSEATILKWLEIFCRRFFAQQFKRSCMPDGPKIGSVCLSPRGDWRMPSDASAALWLKEIDQLKEEL